MHLQYDYLLQIYTYYTVHYSWIILVVMSTGLYVARLLFVRITNLLIIDGLSVFYSINNTDQKSLNNHSTNSICTIEFYKSINY